MVELVGAEVVVALAQVADLEALPEEPTLAQASVVRPVVARLLAAPVGAGLSAGLAALMGVALSEREHGEVVAGWERLRAHASGGQFTALADWQHARTARVAREVAAGRPERWDARSGAASIGKELAPLLGVAPATATALVNLAVRVGAGLPSALDALIEAGMTTGHLGALDAVTKDAHPGIHRQLEAEAIRLAPQRTHAQLRQDLAELAARLDPEHAAAAAAAGVEARGVWVKSSSKAGCKRLVADLPTHDAMATSLALEEIVRYAQAAGDDRLRGQLRADALVGAVTGVMDDVITTTTTAGGGSDTRSPVPTRDDLADLFETQVVTPGDDAPHAPDDGDTPGGGDGDGPDSDGPSGDGPRDRNGRDGSGPGDGAPGGDGPSGDGPSGGAPGDGEAGDGEAPDPGADARPDAPSTSAGGARRDPLAGWTPPTPVPAPEHRPRCRTPIVIAASTLTGRNEHPASLPGGGPLDAPTARAIAARARYRWLHVEDTTGYLLHHEARAHPPPGPGAGWGSASPPTPPPLPAAITAAMTSPGYVPGALLRAHVEVRDATCIGPACHHHARGTDLDHTINYGEREGGTPDGRLGTTTASNLGPECRGVHLAKTHGGWHLTQPSPGHFEWTSPLGVTFTRTARPVLPGWTHLTAHRGTDIAEHPDHPEAHDHD